MTTLSHPPEFKDGSRVLMLTGRNKDGVEPRRVFRDSHYVDQFDRRMIELLELRKEGERIYASAAPRNLTKAAREFKRRQLDADYDPNPMDFYRHIGTRWVSCLMKPENVEKKRKLWMFDCDSAEEQEMVYAAIENCEVIEATYSYPTKNGHHILVRPFDRCQIPAEARKLLDDNPMMLWSW